MSSNACVHSGHQAGGRGRGRGRGKIPDLGKTTPSGGQGIGEEVVAVVWGQLLPVAWTGVVTGNGGMGSGLEIESH